jgi:hypothetical protein
MAWAGVEGIVEACVTTVQGGTMWRNCGFGIAALAFLTSCDLGTTDFNDPIGTEGQTQILLTDSPFPYNDVARVEIHVVQVAVSTTADTGASANEQDWIVVAEPRQRYDLLTLRNGATALLGESPLSAGQYLALRLILNADSSSVTRRDGREAIVQWQGAGEMTLNALVEGAIDVPEAGARIVIDFDVGRSFAVRSGPGAELLFFPVLRAVNEASTGAIAGTVRGNDSTGAVPIGGGVVSVFRGNIADSPGTWSLAATSPVDSAGRYAVHFLQVREYVVQAAPPPGTGWLPGTVGPVPVTAGETTTADILLGGSSGGTGDGYLRIIGDTSLAVGQSAFFFAAVFDARGDSVVTDSVTWSSSDTTVARITLPGGLSQSQSATVTGVAAGTAVIEARSGTRADAAWVTVGDTTPPPGDPTLPVATVAIEPDTQTVTLGDSAWVRAVLRDSTGAELSNRVVTWSVDTPDVLRIDGQFEHYLLFTAIAADTVVVTGTSEGRSGSGEVRVRP